MSFQTPLLLLLILPAALGIAATFRSARVRSRSAYLLALLRLGCISLLLTALAEPFSTVSRPADRILALIDTSASIAESTGTALLQRTRTLARELRVPVYLLPFSKQAAPAEVRDEGDSYRALRARWEQLDSGGTDIEQALAYTHGATGALTLLLSDGYETSTQERRATTTLPPLHTRIFPLTEPGEPEDAGVTISLLHAPLTVKALKSADVRTSLTNTSTRDQVGNLQVTHGGKVILNRALTIPAGRDLTVTAPSDPALEGIHEITATFTYRDAERKTQHSTTRTVWMTGEKRSKVLLLSGTPDDERHLSKILSGQSYQLRSEVAQDGVSALGDPSQYLITILNNVPRSAVPQSFLDALPTAIKGGTNLVMIGGNRSFGLGGYIDSPLDPILPVRMLPPQTEKKRLNIAIQLVIDKSRSMAAEDRLEFAKAAGNEVIQSLFDEDYIGVIGFDSNPFLALPLSLVRDARGIARDRISRLFPRDKTNLFPALDEARRGIINVSAGRKHIIVLSDGKIPDAGSIYLDLIKQMRVLGITVSTVLIGSDEGQGFFAQMARAGGGSFYQTDDPSNLPRIFLSDVKVAAGERTLRESATVLVSAGPAGIVSTSLSEFPPLRGFVESAPRDDARTELVVSEGDKSYPLLASWRVGKGHTVAFTSDANARWSSHWMRWSEIHEFWSDVLESLLPKNDPTLQSIAFDLRSWVEGGALIIDLAVYNETAAAAVTGVVTDPRTETHSLLFKQQNPGHYRATLARPVAGTYRAELRVGDTPLPPVAWSISGDVFGERPHHLPNLPLLEQIAARSGATVDPTAQELRSSAAAISEQIPHRALFLTVALAVLLGEVLCREFGPRLWRYMQGRRGAGGTGRGIPQAP